MSRLLFTVVLILFSSIVSAACWEEIATSVNKDVIFLDKCSVVLDGKYKKAWIKWEYKNERNIGEEYSPKKMVDSSIQLNYFDCMKKKSSIAQVIHYNQDSVVESVSTNTKNLYFNEDIPDSVGETILESACGKIKKSKTKGLIKNIIHFIGMSPPIINNENKECWDKLYDNYEIKTYIFTCLKNNYYDTSFKQGYIKIERNDYSKFMASNSEKVYYNSAILQVITNCSFFIVTGRHFSLFSDGEYLASSDEESPDELSDYIDKNIEKAIKTICGAELNEAPAAPAPESEPPQPKQIKQTPIPSNPSNTTQPLKHNLTGSRSIDAIPLTFCWKDVYSDKNIDIYYSYCNLRDENGYKKTWIRNVFANDVPIKKSNGKDAVYDETITEIYIDCQNKAKAILQNYWISPDGDVRSLRNNIINSIEINLYENIVFNRLQYGEINNKLIASVCN